MSTCLCLTAGCNLLNLLYLVHLWHPAPHCPQNSHCSSLCRQQSLQYILHSATLNTAYFIYSPSCKLHTLQCTPHTMHCKCSVHCIMYSTKCVHTAQYIMHTGLPCAILILCTWGWHFLRASTYQCLRAKTIVNHSALKRWMSHCLHL